MDKRLVMLSLLAKMMKADGKNAKLESDLLASFNKLFGSPVAGPELIALARNSQPLEDLLGEVQRLDLSERLDVLNFCYQMANADKNYAVEEDALILKIAAACGLNTAAKDQLRQFFVLSSQVNALQGQLAVVRQNLLKKGA